MAHPVSQFYILSSRGDSIIAKDFRGDIPKSSGETFFRNVKFFGGKQQEAPPIFNLNGVSYIWIKTSGLYFVFTNKFNCSPALCVELLRRLTKVFKDYCGTLSEESVRSNFTLIYELLDEVMDFGHVQSTESTHLKSFVHNKPILLKEKSKSGLKLPRGSTRTKSSKAVDKPIVEGRRGGKGKRRKNEIFVDIYEKIDVTFNSSGLPLNSAIQGLVQMKSYLAGNPEIKFALNEELVIGKGSRGYGAVEIDDCNFHECVQLDDFETQRVLSFHPPDGEFVLMNYRMTGDFRVPFRLFPFFELATPYKVELIVKIRADIPEHNWGGNVLVEVPMPKQTGSVVSELAVGAAGQTVAYDQKTRKIQWKIKKFPGGVEHTLRTKITLKTAHSTSVRREIGPISMQFEIPMYNPSGVQVRYLRILENNKSYNPYRWVRYVTRASSYICRV